MEHPVHIWHLTRSYRVVVKFYVQRNNRHWQVDNNLKWNVVTREHNQPAHTNFNEIYMRENSRENILQLIFVIGNCPYWKGENSKNVFLKIFPETKILPWNISFPSGEFNHIKAFKKNMIGVEKYIFGSISRSEGVREKFCFEISGFWRKAYMKKWLKALHLSLSLSLIESSLLGKERRSFQIDLSMFSLMKLKILESSCLLDILEIILPVVS